MTNYVSIVRIEISKTKKNSDELFGVEATFLSFIKIYIKSLGYSTVLECLLTIHKALSLRPSTRKQKEIFIF